MLELPAINREATRRRVENELGRIRMYRRMGSVRREAATTASYEARLHGATNRVSKPSETVAIWNVDKETELARRSQMMDKALACLNELERELIMKRYLETDDTYDYLICGDLGVSERKYRRVKAAAIAKLAWALQLEVPAIG
ncbi:ArpU family transcriptional regulator [Paenibacillus sp. CAA11]|nr:ArpU family transcriptional regulator [Paenibacillus sp. CAA11]